MPFVFLCHCSVCGHDQVYPWQQGLYCCQNTCMVAEEELIHFLFLGMRESNSLSRHLVLSSDHRAKSHCR